MYDSNGTIASGASKTAVGVTGGTAFVMLCKELNMCMDNSSTTPGETFVNGQIRRSTAAGTGGGTTAPSVRDPGSRPASRAAVQIGPTAEPTYSGFILDGWWHARSQYLWNAIDVDSIIKVPLTSAAGLGAQLVAAGGGNGNFKARLSWIEN